MNEQHEHSHVTNRRMRRFRQRHAPRYTSSNVWRDVQYLNEFGIRLRFERIAKRRGKTGRAKKNWVERRTQEFLAAQRQAIRDFNLWIEEQMKKYEEEQNVNTERQASVEEDDAEASEGSGTSG